MKTRNLGKFQEYKHFFLEHCTGTPLQMLDPKEHDGNTLEKKSTNN